MDSALEEKVKDARERYPMESEEAQAQFLKVGQREGFLVHHLKKVSCLGFKIERILFICDFSLQKGPRRVQFAVCAWVQHEIVCSVIAAL